MTFHVIKVLLEGNIINNDSTAVFLLYRCHTSDGSLMAPGEISHLCAKLSYLMKLTVLEAVAAEAPVNRLDAFSNTFCLL